MSTSKLRTASEVSDWLVRHGVSVTEWARANGFDRSVVYALLNGRTQGRHGKAHHAAVALGMKGAAPDGETHPLLNASKATTKSTSEKSLNKVEGT